MTPHDRFVAGLGGILAGATMGLFTLANMAHAQTAPACPTKPPALTAGGEVTDELVELRELRRDAADTCEALLTPAAQAVARLEAVRDRLATSEELSGGTLAGRLDGLDSRLAGIRARLDDPLNLVRGHSGSSPLFTQAVASEAASSTEHGQSDTDPTWVRLSTPSRTDLLTIPETLYIALGVTLGLFFAGQLLRRLR